jgi:DNA-binding transcriptional MerR regulator
VTLDTGRPYFSIGEVLNVLKDSFPDVTVSKIRFLESEGLIQPERTQSGYRKFTEDDIERLRFILKLQREHFLPLKVIRERLDELDSAGSGAGQSRLALEQAEQTAADPKTIVDMSGGGVSMSGVELCNASGLTEDQIQELNLHRLLHPTEIREQRDGTEQGAPILRYDENDLEVAKLCRAMLDLGLEPRHLKVFRNAADRWADLAEQVGLPLSRQRHPDARRAAQEKTREVVRIGSNLVRALLRVAVGPRA